MFRRSLNRAVFGLKIETRTPLLIRAGDSGLNPVAPDLSCVRTRYAGEQLTVYIPGSSLKGVLRAAAESRVRGLTVRGTQGACDPFDRSNCGNIASTEAAPKEDPSKLVHSRHCMACRLFGSTAMRGRAAIRDLYPWSPTAVSAERDNAIRAANRTETRHGVAINRVSGSVQHGPFELEIIPVGIAFWGEIALVNFQSWQVALLAAAIGEVNDGFAQLGSSKTRGLGVVSIEVESVLYEQAGTDATPLGVGKLIDEKEAKPYGLLPESDLPAAPLETTGLTMRARLTGELARQWFAGCVAPLGALR